MKKLFYLLLSLPLFISCDQVDENDRYIKVEDIQVTRKVLLEEFTGQRCVNCPEAHAVIEKLEEQYGEDLIVVSIHAGSFGIKSPFGLMQEEGDEYANRWGVNSYPAGVVDRTGSVMTYDAWSSAIRAEAGRDTDLEIDLKATLSSDRKNIDISTVLICGQGLDASLQLWVVENDITALQYDGDRTVTDYKHNNVFRACVNGLWGQQISLNSNISEEYTNSIEVFNDPTYKVASWDVDNLYIVGFVYDNSGVIQVNRVKVE